MKHVKQCFSIFSLKRNPLQQFWLLMETMGLARNLSRRHREVRGRMPRAGKRSLERGQLESLGERCKLPRQGLGPSPDRFGRTASAFCQQSSSLRSTLPAQHVRPSGFFCCWSDGLELTARSHAGSRVFCGQLQTVAEDILIFAVLVCSAH